MTTYFSPSSIELFQSLDRYKKSKISVVSVLELRTESDRRRSSPGLPTPKTGTSIAIEPDDREAEAIVDFNTALSRANAKLDDAVTQLEAILSGEALSSFSFSSTTASSSESETLSNYSIRQSEHSSRMTDVLASSRIVDFAYPLSAPAEESSEAANTPRTEPDSNLETKEESSTNRTTVVSTTTTNKSITGARLLVKEEPLESGGSSAQANLDKMALVKVATSQRDGLAAKLESASISTAPTPFSSPMSKAVRPLVATGRRMSSLFLGTKTVLSAEDNDAAIIEAPRPSYTPDPMSMGTILSPPPANIEQTAASAAQEIRSPQKKKITSSTIASRVLEKFRAAAEATAAARIGTTIGLSHPAREMPMREDLFGNFTFSNSQSTDTDAEEDSVSPLDVRPLEKRSAN